MPNLQKPTKKQHYVPQVYLKGFSQDEKMIYRYDLANESQKLVPISSVCYKKDLYEFKDEKGKKIASNYIEKILCEFEAEFSTHRNELKKFVEENFEKNTICALNPNINAFWVSYIAVQILRRPWLLDIVQKNSEQHFSNDSTFSDEMIRTFSILFCFPFIKSIMMNEHSLYNILVQTLKKLSLVIGVDKKDRIYTSDSPVYCFGSSLTDIEKVIFPLTSNKAIYLLSKDYINTFGKILVFEMTDYEIDEINLSALYNAHSSIFSKYPFIETELKQKNLNKIELMII